MKVNHGSCNFGYMIYMPLCCCAAADFHLSKVCQCGLQCWPMLGFWFGPHTTIYHDSQVARQALLKALDLESWRVLASFDEFWRAKFIQVQGKQGKLSTRQVNQKVLGVRFLHFHPINCLRWSWMFRNHSDANKPFWHYLTSPIKISCGHPNNFNDLSWLSECQAAKLALSQVCSLQTSSPQLAQPVCDQFQCGKFSSLEKL